MCWGCHDKYHRLRGLRSGNVCLRFWRREVCEREVCRAVSSEGQEGRTCPGLHPPCVDAVLVLCPDMGLLLCMCLWTNSQSLDWTHPSDLILTKCICRDPVSKGSPVVSRWGHSPRERKLPSSVRSSYKALAAVGWGESDRGISLDSDLGPPGDVCCGGPTLPGLGAASSLQVLVQELILKRVVSLSLKQQWQCGGWGGPPGRGPAPSGSGLPCLLILPPTRVPQKKPCASQ